MNTSFSRCRWGFLFFVPQILLVCTRCSWVHLVQKVPLLVYRESRFVFVSASIDLVSERSYPICAALSSFSFSLLSHELWSWDEWSLQSFRRCSVSFSHLLGESLVCFWSHFGTVPTPGKVHHRSTFSPFVNNTSYCGSLGVPVKISL